MKHAKLKGNNIEFAGKTLMVDGVVYSNPSDEIYLSQGWKKYVETIDPYPVLSSSVSSYFPVDTVKYFKGYEQDDATISAEYGWKTETVVKKYSKLKILVALTKLVKWDAVRYFLNETAVPGTDTKYKELWDAAQLFTSDNEYFKAALGEIQAMLQLTDEQVEELMKQCEE